MDLTSPTLGALDNLPTLRALQQHNAEMDAAARERNAKQEHLRDALMDALSEGVLKAPALFAPQWPDRKAVGGKRVPSVAEVLGAALDVEDTWQEALQLVVDAALGMPVRERAAAVLRKAATEWADAEADR